MAVRRRRTPATGAYRIGVDLGGTKIEVLALDRGGHERHRRRVATPQGDYDATLDTIAALVRDAETTLGQRASVGIGTPGSISRATGLLRGANSVCLNGRPIREDLARKLGRDVRVTNDANCFALSEAADGAGEGAEVVFGVILGTGVGAGIVVRGRSSTGRTGSPASGATTRCRGRATTSVPARAAFAGARAASRPSCRGPASRATTFA